MHFWQALKMASKSLLTNKLRSFLTMLGIIIGVVTVTLLTSVVQGVSSLVISSIKSQSTLAVFINFEKTLNMSDAGRIISNYQPKNKNANDYFDYSLIYSVSGLVANSDKDTVLNGSIQDYLTPKKSYTMNDFPDYDDMTAEEKKIVDYLVQEQKHNYSYTTMIYAVDSNFQDVYDFEIDGRYVENSNEIIVDNQFIETYFGKNYSKSEAKGKEITLGINNYTELKFKFLSEADFNRKHKFILGYLKESHTFKDGNINFSIVPNIDGSEFTYETDGVENFVMTVNIKMFNYLSNEELSDLIDVLSKTEKYSKLQDVEFEANDIYDTTNAKTFKITGIVSDESSNLISSIIGSTSDIADTASENSVFMKYILSVYSSMGNVYILYDDDNAHTLRQPSVEESAITLSFLRYKDENFVTSGTTGLILEFSNAGFKFMSDFMFITFSTVLNLTSTIMDIMTFMLILIAIISLIVGGIGIMNIMLVAITERTREIGIRKAIGAKKSSILTQFLIEALLISLFGCVIGLGISAIAIMILSSIIKTTIIIPLWVIGLSVGFCTLIGLIFGIFPAIKASNMQPIDALRRE